MDIIALAISIISLCVAVLTFWKTWTSLSMTQDESDGTIHITNNSPHAVTLVELGRVSDDGSLTPLLSNEDAPGLPYRLDAHDRVSFRPGLHMTIEQALFESKKGRGGCYARIASRNLFGNQGEVCSSISFLSRLWWGFLSKIEERFPKFGN